MTKRAILAGMFLCWACGSDGTGVDPGHQNSGTVRTTSSLTACGPTAACSDAAEACYSTASCGPPPGGCQTPETGDLKCHRVCADDAACAPSERCVLQYLFVPPRSTDVASATRLCVPR